MSCLIKSENYLFLVVDTFRTGDIPVVDTFRTEQKSVVDAVHKVVCRAAGGLKKSTVLNVAPEPVLQVVDLLEELAQGLSWSVG